jgi:hypothetical protein
LIQTMPVRKIIFKTQVYENFSGINLGIAKGAPDPVPFGLTIYKGAKSYRLPRQFVDFLLTTPGSYRLYRMEQGRISSLKMVLDKWVVEQYYVPQPRYHFQKWYTGCRGRYRNAVCVFSLKDLSTILQSGCYIVNKMPRPN